MSEEKNPHEVIVQPSAASPAQQWMRPQSIEGALALADVLAKSSMVPDAYRGKPGDIVAAVIMGAEVGLAPMAAMQNIAVINGKPCLFGDALLAVVLASGHCENIEERDPVQALAAKEGRCVVTRRGMAPHEVRFSLDDAQRAGLAGKSGPWKQYPGRMLMMRARAFALRDRFADVLRGFASAEEVGDYPAREEPAPFIAPRAKAPAAEIQPTPEVANSRTDLERVRVTGWTKKTSTKGVTFWQVRLSDGREATTFSTTFGGIIETAAASGAEIGVALASNERDGKQWLALKEVEA